MMDEELPRADEHMSREVFGTLYQLSTNHPWLIRRSNELYDTIQLCDDDDQKALVIDLISRFHFRSTANHLEDLRTIADKIANDWKCEPASTMLIALDDRGCADSTAMVVQQLKGPLAEHGDWTTGNFISSLGEVVRRAKENSNIVIVDDFCGSGETISKKVIWLNEKLEKAGKSVKMRVAVGTSMEGSKTVVEPVVDEFYSVHWINRGIRDYFHGQAQCDAVAHMQAIEDKLEAKSKSKKLVDYSFGWRQTEALFYLEGSNPPNNNFPIFWWPLLKPDMKRKALLPRV